MTEIRYKVVKVTPDGRFVSYVARYNHGQLEYKIGEITKVQPMFVEFIYYPLVFDTLENVRLFLSASLLRKDRTPYAVLECEVEGQVNPLPRRMTYDLTREAFDKFFFSAFDWPLGTEMWKVVKPIRVLSMSEFPSLITS